MSALKFPFARRIILFLHASSKTLAVASAGALLFGFFNHTFFVVSLVSILSSLASYLLASVLTFLFYVQYSLTTLVTFVLLGNLFVVCIFSDGGFPLSMLGVTGLFILSAVVAISAFNVDLKNASDLSKWVVSRTGGVVKRILVKSGDAVTAGQQILVLEAPDQERVVESECNAKIESIYVRAGERVSAGTLLGTLRLTD